MPGALPKEISKKVEKSEKIEVSNVYELTDRTGKYRVYRESGMINQGKNLVVKKRMLGLNNDEKKILEKSITISTLGVLGKKIRVLRPQISQYTVWLEGKKYFSEMKLNIKSRSLDVRLESPEEEWKGVRAHKFPEGTGVYCFFSQLFECVKATTFFQKAQSMQSGKMNFHIVWDGYPYLAEQYEGVPNELFTEAMMEYDKELDGGSLRFNLKFRDQDIFFLLNREITSAKIYWVAQGYSFLPIRM